MKVLLATSERLSGCIVNCLEGHGHRVVGVVSPFRGVYERQFTRPRFWAAELRGWDILRTCRKKNIEFRISRVLEEGSVTAFIKSQAPDLLVLFGWPGLVQPKTLAFFPKGGMNIHPSLLPRFRGADPLFALIDSGSDAFGLSFHKATDQLDEGPIYRAVPLAFSQWDTYDRLYAKVLDGIHAHLPLALTSLDRNPNGAEQQGEATYAPRFRHRLRTLDPKQDLAQTMRRTLACYSHHSRLTACGNRLLHFTKCTPLADRPGDLEDGVIEETGMFSLTVRLGGRRAKLSGIRFFRKPNWLTPFLLDLHCRPGRRLRDAQHTWLLYRDAKKSMVGNPILKNGQTK